MKHFINKYVLAFLMSLGLSLPVFAGIITKEQSDRCMAPMIIPMGDTFDFDEDLMRVLAPDCNEEVWHPLMERGKVGSPGALHGVFLLKEARTKGVIPDLRQVRTLNGLVIVTGETNPDGSVTLRPVD